jgi:hypothetical protein
MNKINVWKVGTRWGNCGHSVLDLFLDYGMVFVGGTDDGKRQGDYSAVKPGDLFLLSDGAKPVALGVAQDVFSPLEESGIHVRAVDRNLYFDDAVLVCKAAIRLLCGESPKWSFDSQKRFCQVCQSPDAIKEYWTKLLESDTGGTFNIDARTVVLFGDNDQKSLFHPHVRYLIPIYQRPYSWGEIELTRLFQDITRGIRGGEPLFLGTMQLSKPTPLDVRGQLHRHDIIDGQQRITSLLVLIRVMGLMDLIKLSALDVKPVLRTLVDHGSAQTDLDDFLSADIEAISASDTSRNPYMRNASFIRAKLTELFQKDENDAESDSFTAEDLERFLHKDIRIVVIETHAGLSKTLQIFDVINTTGLDLSGADVFKVRFFEFLTTKRGAAENIFEEISALYGMIQERNRTCTTSVSMPQILIILQTLIIATYEFDSTLYDYATDRFFDQLFDSLLGINRWDHFAVQKLGRLCQDVSEKSPLSVAGIARLIDCRYEFEQRYNSPSNNVISDIVLNKFMWQTRYGWRHWYLPVICLYLNHEDKNGLETFYGELVRFAVCYSLLYAKVVGLAHRSIRESLKLLFKSPADAAAHLALCRMQRKSEVNQAIGLKELAWNPTWKGLACRLSEYLDHKDGHGTANPKLVNDIFYERVDIEHIQSYHDKDGNRRKDIWDTWGATLNGLGNLAMLEYSINRSIGNAQFNEKKKEYERSRYRTIQKLCEQADWQLPDAQKRCVSETEKLMGWLFPDGE